MTSITPQVRQLGVPQAQNREQTPAANRVVENLVNNLFTRTVIELPQNVRQIYRCEDFAAVLSLPNFPQDVNFFKIAVWHLPSATQKCETTFAHSIEKFRTQFCWLSRTGAFLMQTVWAVSKQKYFVIDQGVVNREFPERSWASFDIEGDRTLTSWYDGNFGDKDRIRYFTESDLSGKLIYQLELTKTIISFTKLYTFNHQYWVCLAGSHYPKRPSLIEVINRAARTRTSFDLPLTKRKIEITQACIALDHLFYAMTHNKKTFKVRQFNLAQNMPIRTFKAIIKPDLLIPKNPGFVEGPQRMVATQQYAAWLFTRKAAIDGIVCLDINKNTVHQLQIDPFHAERMRVYNDVILSICGSLLTVTYRGHNRIMTFDLAAEDPVNRESDAFVEKGECCFSHGILLIKTYHDDLTAMMTICNFDHTTPYKHQT